jgi:hypothetical protein
MAQMVAAAAVAPLPTNYDDAVVDSAVAHGGSAAAAPASVSSPPTRPSPLTPWASGSVAKRWRPTSAFTTPVFVVKEKGVECKLCDTMIGYNVRKHVVECKTHRARLDGSVAFMNAVSLEEAEELLAPRTSEGRNKRKKRYKKEKRGSSVAGGVEQGRSEPQHSVHASGAAPQRA